MTSEAIYEYRPIAEADGIRLIELQPSQDAFASLKCRLIHTQVSLCDNNDIYGHYIALSYVWGSPEKCRNVLVDDGKRLDITSNLNSALLDLRDKQRSLLVWADGVCINQGDDEEKAKQIGLMGRIFAGAQHTVIYLGSAASTDPENICLTSIQSGSYRGDGPELESLLTKEWFTRVWVFQELIFSTSPWLQCGKTRIKWDLLFNTLGWGSTEANAAPKSRTETKYGDVEAQHDSAMDKTYHIVKDMQRARKHHNSGSKTDEDNTSNFPPKISGNSPAPNSMTELLLARRGFGVTDRRDMVFAHVGFASDGQHESFAVDYSKTAAEIFEKSARYIANFYGLSTLLQCVGVGSSPSRPGDLPSWVPDWTSKVPAKTYPGQVIRFSNGSSWRPLSLTKPGMFSCEFNRVDTVRFVSPALSVQQIPQQDRQQIASRIAFLGTFSYESDIIYLKD